jgi:arylsulfatase A
VDDLGWMDLSCQGSSFYETPHIDRLASQGTRFTNAYANCPVCSPSRAALLTGRYPARVRFTGHITATGRHRYPSNGRIIPPDDFLYLRPDEVTIAEALRTAGYASASIGKWHLGGEKHWPERQGFDRNVGGYEQGMPPSYFYPYENPASPSNPKLLNLAGGNAGEYLTDRLTKEAITFIEGHRKQPFFLYLPHYAVHTPLEAPEALVRKYERKLLRDQSQKSAVYAAMIDSVDTGIGRIVKSLDELDLAAQTMFIVTSDNGGESRSTSNAPLRAGKGYLYDGGIRVPLIVRWPGRVGSGAVSDVPVMGCDLFPTVLASAGAAIPQRVLDGQNLMPALLGNGRLRSRDLFWYYPHYSPQARQPGAAVRSGEWKLIQHYDPPALELFNVAKDPGEKENLAARMPKKASELVGRLENWLKEVQPVLHTPNPDYRPSE